MDLSASTSREQSEAQKIDALLSTLSKRPSPTLTPKQTRLLELYKTVQENELSLALLNAWNKAPPITSTSAEELEAATQAALLSRAQHVISLSATKQAMTADPVLRAVHGPTDEAQSADQSSEIISAQMVAKRDSLSMLLASIASRASSLEQRARELELQRAQVWATLPEKAARAVELGKALDPDVELHNLDGDGDASMVDAEWKEELQKADEALKRARWEYRVVKGVAAAMVAGSGVAWSEEEKLVRMVLEDE